MWPQLIAIFERLFHSIPLNFFIFGAVGSGADDRNLLEEMGWEREEKVTFQPRSQDLSIALGWCQWETKFQNQRQEMPTLRKCLSKVGKGNTKTWKLRLVPQEASNHIPVWYIVNMPTQCSLWMKSELNILSSCSWLSGFFVVSQNGDRFRPTSTLTARERKSLLIGRCGNGLIFILFYFYICIYFFLSPWAGGIQQILQSDWFRKRAESTFAKWPLFITRETT